jgi:hypothetical protein
MKLKIIIFFALLALQITSKRHHEGNMAGNSTHKNYHNLTCNYNNCPEERGICNIDNECFCFIGFVTTKQGDLTGKYCDYEQKYQMTAFLLEFLISFGLGHMYIQKYFIGSIKLTFCLAFIYVTCLLPIFFAKRRRFTFNKYLPYFQFLSMLMFCLWQIIDTIFFGLNMYKDGNGYSLKSW